MSAHCIARLPPLQVTPCWQDHCRKQVAHLLLLNGGLSSRTRNYLGQLTESLPAGENQSQHCSGVPGKAAWCWGPRGSQVFSLQEVPAPQSPLQPVQGRWVFWERQGPWLNLLRETYLCVLHVVMMVFQA